MVSLHFTRNLLLCLAEDDRVFSPRKSVTDQVHFLLSDSEEGSWDGNQSGDDLVSSGEFSAWCVNPVIKRLYQKHPLDDVVKLMLTSVESRFVEQLSSTVVQRSRPYTALHAAEQNS